MGYWLHVLYSTAISTLSIHLVVHRNSYKDEKSRILGKISVLEEMANRLKTGEQIPAEEMKHLRRLLKRNASGYEEEISWKEALLGKKDVKTGEYPYCTALLARRSFLAQHDSRMRYRASPACSVWQSDVVCQMGH